MAEYERDSDVRLLRDGNLRACIAMVNPHSLEALSRLCCFGQQCLISDFDFQCCIFHKLLLRLLTNSSS